MIGVLHTDSIRDNLKNKYILSIEVSHLFSSRSGSSRPCPGAQNTLSLAPGQEYTAVLQRPSDPATIAQHTSMTATHWDTTIRSRSGVYASKKHEQNWIVTIQP